MVRRQNHERREMAGLVVSVLESASAPMSAREITCALNPLAGPALWWRVCGALEALQSMRDSPVRQAERREDGQRVYALDGLDEQLRQQGRIVERVVRIAPLRELVVW